MNALVRKEVRLLLPSFAIGLVAVLAIWLIPNRPDQAMDFKASLGILAFLVSPGLLVLMTMASFGRELSGGTFSFLLSQPVPRSRVWWTKALLLAAAAGILWMAWWLALSSNSNFLEIPREDRSDAFLTAFLFTIVVYSGGLWTTVFFRELAAAFWFTLLTPAALALALAALLGNNSDEANPVLRSSLIGGLAGYSAIGFQFARWLFLRAQDTHWTGGEITLPGVRGWTGWLGGRGERRRLRPKAALWKKELQLYQSQFVLAGLLALVHLAVIAVRTWGGDFKDYPALEFVLEHFWVLWAAMPLLVGSAAVAEERRLGTLEAQLCLPSRRRTQFGIKFVGALLLSIGLGVVMPLMLEGHRILPDFEDQFTGDPSNFAIRTSAGTHLSLGTAISIIRALLPHLTLVGITLAIALAGFYASTLSRSSMQALAPALLAIMVIWFSWFAALEVEQVVHYPLWRGWLVFLIGVPVLAAVLGGLACWNFKHVPVGWPVWRRNVLLWLTALGGITLVTTATYHRVWELFLTLEPPHGPARLDRSRPFSMMGHSYHLSVQFPDGRNWSSRLTLTAPDWTAMLSGDWKVSEIPGSAGFLKATNWVTVIRSYRDTIGIQQDGSLWVSEGPEAVRTPGSPPPSPNPGMIRLGQDSDWRAVATMGSLAFLLKTNGTLWSLGTNRANWTGWPGFRAFSPERLGRDSDWSSIHIADPGRIAFQKTDRSEWIYQPNARPQPEEQQIRLGTDILLTAAPYLEGQKSAASIWADGRYVQLGVGVDGVLRVIAVWHHETAIGARLGWGWQRRNIPLGQETNWLDLAGNQRDVVALQADGSLWKLNFPANPLVKLDTFSASPLSRHSNWVAVTEAVGGMVSLAADGSLWFWAMDGRTHSPSGSASQPLLAVSRRPQLIGYILNSPVP